MSDYVKAAIGTLFLAMTLGAMGEVMISNAHMMAILALIALLAALAVLCFFLARRARNLRKRMNEILEVLPIGVTVFDDTMRLRLFNTPYQNLFGSLGDKIERGMTYRDLISLTIAGNRRVHWLSYFLFLWFWIVAKEVTVDLFIIILLLSSFLLSR